MARAGLLRAVGRARARWYLVAPAVLAVAALEMASLPAATANGAAGPDQPGVSSSDVADAAEPSQDDDADDATGPDPSPSPDPTQPDLPQPDPTHPDLSQAVPDPALPDASEPSYDAAPADDATGPDLATSSVLRVAVGADRTGPGQHDVTGLDGVTLGVYSATGTLVDTCVSTGGVCELVVPDTHARAGTVPAGQNYNQRFWIRQANVPTGWYTNPQLRTGGVSASPANVRTYEFQTPALTQRTYAPGDLLSSASMSSSSTAGELASLGLWQQSRTNPVLTPSCGVGRVAILADWSSSVDVSPGYPVLRQTLDQVADAFAGTPSFLSFFAFGYQSLPVDHTPFPMSTPAGVQAFKDLYKGWGSFGTQGTNWDAGLRAVAAVNPDLVIVLTDGNPTVWGAGAQGQGNASSNQLADVEAAIFAANTLKASGTRVVALGVGDGVAAASRGDLNLRAISGPTRFTGSNHVAADYFQTASYADAADAFRQLAVGSCEGTLTVVKQVVTPGGSIAAGDTMVAGPGWQFTVSGDAVEGGTRTTETDQTGTVDFPLASDAQHAELRISERQFPGYTLLPVDGQPGGPKAECRTIGSGAPLQVLDDPENPYGVIVPDAPVYGATTCTFYNMAPEGSTWVQVDKRWVVNGTPVADGQQPTGLSASLQLAARPGGALQGSAYPIDGAQFGQRYSRYSVSADEERYLTAADGVTVDEQATAGPYCTLRPELTTLHALAAEEADGSHPGDKPLLRPAHQVNLLADGAWNHYVITNHAECELPAISWTLAKTSDPASGTVVDPGDPVTYTLTATNLEPDALVGPRRVTVVDDLSDVLDVADLVEGSVTASVGTATLEGTRLTWEMDALDEVATLTYQVVVHADAYGAVLSNAAYGQPTAGDLDGAGAGVPPQQCASDEPCQTRHTTPRPDIEGAVFDLALRMWVGEVYRDGDLVSSRHPTWNHPGPDYDVPYVGFDNPDYDTQVGDVLVHHINVFNQGDQAARLEQVVNYLPTGLVMADPAALAEIVGHHGLTLSNDGWTRDPDDGWLYYSPPDGPVVLEPGEVTRILLTLEVDGVAEPAPGGLTEIDNHAEIFHFSGLVPLDRAQEADLVVLNAETEPERDAVWLPVRDTDSHPDNINDEPDGAYRTNVIHEQAVTNLPGIRDDVQAARSLAAWLGADTWPDVDEDDHDGTHLRVLAAPPGGNGGVEDGGPDGTVNGGPNATGDGPDAPGAPAGPDGPDWLASTGWALSALAVVLIASALAAGTTMVVQGRRATSSRPRRQD